MNLAPRGAAANGRQHVSHAVASGGRRRDTARCAVNTDTKRRRRRHIGYVRLRRHVKSRRRIISHAAVSRQRCRRREMFRKRQTSRVMFLPSGVYRVWSALALRGRTIHLTMHASVSMHTVTSPAIGHWDACLSTSNNFILVHFGVNLTLVNNFRSVLH